MKKLSELIPRRSTYYRVLGRDGTRIIKETQRKSSYFNEEDLVTKCSINILAVHPELSTYSDIFNAQELATASWKDKGINRESGVRGIYKSLKADGLICSTITELLQTWEDIDSRVYGFLCPHVEGALENFGMSAPLTKETWLVGISHALMYLCRYDAPAMARYIPKTSLEWEDMYLLISLNIILKTSYLVDQIALAAKIPTTVVKVKDEESTKRVETLTQRIAKLEAEQRKMATDTASYYGKLVKSQAKELALLREKLSKFEAVNGDVENKEDTGNSWVPQPLPKTNVTFVAAHPSTQLKLAELYPDWDYIPVDMLPKSYPDNPICFVNTSHISHVQYNHVKAYCPSTILVCSLKNMDRLLDEMATSFNNYLSGRQSVQTDLDVEESN